MISLYNRANILRAMREYEQALPVIREAIQVALRLDQYKMQDEKLGMMYQEKAAILRALGGAGQAKSKGYNVQAYQCYNTAYAIFLKR